MSLQMLNNSAENGAVFVTSTSGLVQNLSLDEHQLLQDINDRRATLLLPAIIMTVLLMLIGLLGNPLALYIYGWRWPPSSTKYFLVCLAVIDLMNCLITMPTEILVMRQFYLFESDALCKVSRFTTYVMNNATSAIFIAIAIDRYVRICHPHSKPFSARKAKVACAVGLLIGLAVSWPALVLYGKITVQVYVRQHPPLVVRGAMCMINSDMEKYTLAFFAYLCTAVLLCTLILKSSSSSSPSLPLKVPQVPDTPDEETVPGCNVNNFSLRCKKWRPPKATLMLFLITVVFVVSFLPFLIITIIRQHRGARFYTSLTTNELLMVNIFLRSYLVNNCANPIVYGLCNARFRDECKRLWDRALRRSKSTNQSSRQNSVRSKSHCETPKRERKFLPDG
ncbi:hypothetical protein C0Q70_07545 [Pomacea canaliculata]|uniref:G-protein coupled receptors family 1 profile domain-containing protein n=1 Tax=Pomacea canaliculata TaxID=400727 RepID=A0A2T7PFC7_POMCA|nr:hypothetical protein C0Q70_07545 [Pomacea canaliculata]